MRPDPQLSWTLLTVIACASPPRVTVAPVTEVVHEAVPVVPPAAEPPAPVPAGIDIEVACAEMDPAAPEMVRVRIEDAVLECPESLLGNCQGKAQLFFANCSDEPVTLRGVQVITGGRSGTIYEFEDRVIASREIWGWTRKVFSDESAQLKFDVVDNHDVPIHVAQKPTRTSNPTRDAAMAACVACDGMWSVRRGSLRDACNCKARDAHKECRDGDECEGACQFDRWEISQPARRGRCTGTGKQRVCTARVPEVGRPVGRCTELVAMPSCQKLLQRGITSQPDQQIPWGATRRCSN